MASSGWLARHWKGVLYGGLLAVILVWAAMLRFRLPQTPLFDGDSWGYLYPGFSKLTGGTFEHVYGRNFVYPGFVFSVLCLFGNYEALGVAQHVLGLLTGAVLAGCWNILCRCLHLSARVRTATQFGGLLLVADYLFSRSPILFEQTLRPEAVFPLIVALSFLLNFGALHAAWIVPRPALVRWYLGINLIVTYLAQALKPSLGIGALAANLPLLFWLARRGEPWPEKVRVAGFALAVVVVTMWLPERLLARKDPTAVTFLPTMLFTVHARVIHTQILDDLRIGHTKPYAPEWLAAFDQKLGSSLDAASQAENKPWTSLGFNADYLIYQDSVFEPFFGAGHEREEAAFCFHYYAQAWLHQPMRMLGKIGAELRLVYGPRFGLLKPRRLFNNADKYTGKTQRPMSYDYQNTAQAVGNPAVSENLSHSLYGQAYLKRILALGRTHAVVRQYPWVGFTNNLLVALHLPLLLVALGGGILLWIKTRWANAPLIAGVWLVCLVNFGAFLTIAIAHTLDFDRYVENQRLCTVFSEFAVLLLILQVAVIRPRNTLLSDVRGNPL